LNKGPAKNTNLRLNWSLLRQSHGLENDRKLQVSKYSMQTVDYLRQDY